jgi:hypothetical protein
MSRKTFLVLFIFPALGFSATQTGSVRSGSQNIPGATVFADCGTNRISTVTDDAGRFEIGGLPSTSCRFSVAMFGFEPVQREIAPSDTPLVLDLQLQKRATLAAEPAPLAGATPAKPAQVSAASPAPAPASSAASTSSNPGSANTASAGRGQGRGPGRGGYGRGGFAGPGRGGQQTAGAGRGGSATGTGGGFQNLSLIQNGDNAIPNGDVEPSLGGSPDDAGGANEAFLVNGSLSQGVQSQPNDGFGLGGPGLGAGGPGGPGGNPFGGANGNGFDAGGLPTLGGGAPGGPGGGGPGGGGPGGGGPGGGFGGGGGRGGGGRGGGGGGRGGGRGRGGPPNRNVQFGNRINRGRGRQFQGSVFYTIGNSVLNARPYSFTSPTQLNGDVVPKAAYAANRFGFSGGGPLSIPHLFSSDKTFWFVNYTGNRSKNGFDQVSTVPTAAERMGDFTGVTTLLNGVATPVASIPAGSINSIASGLLSYIPLPNAPGLRNNYQLIGANPTNNDNLQTRINQTLTTKDRLDVNVNYQHRDSQTVQNFGFIDPTRGYGLSSGLTYGRTINRSFINSLVWNFSRNLAQTNSSFSNGANIEGNLGITGVTTSPVAYGPPTISFANYTSLNDGTPSLTRSQTSA